MQGKCRRKGERIHGMKVFLPDSSGSFELFEMLKSLDVYMFM